MSTLVLTMGLKETTLKEDINNILLNLKKLLPKKKTMIIFDHDKSPIRHLSSIHAEAKSVFPKCFRGTKFIIQSDLLDKVKLVQHYDFGNTNKTHKAFVEILQKELAPKYVDCGLLLHTSGLAVATYTEKIKHGQVRLMSKIKNLTSLESEILVEKRQERYVSATSFSVKGANPLTLAVLTKYMYRVLPVLCIGGEFRFNPFSRQTTPIFSLSCRYDVPSIALSGTISRTGLQVCAFKELSKDLRIAAIATETARVNVLCLAVHKIGNDYDLKVFIDSQCCAGVTFEKNLVFEETTATRLIRMKVSTMLDRQGHLCYGWGFNLDF